MKLPVQVYEMRAETKHSLFCKYLVIDAEDNDICECNDEEVAKQVVKALNLGIGIYQKAS